MIQTYARAQVFMVLFQHEAAINTNRHLFSGRQ